MTKVSIKATQPQLKPKKEQAVSQLQDSLYSSDFTSLDIGRRKEFLNQTVAQLRDQQGPQRQSASNP